MIDVASMMRLAADAVENYETKVAHAREQGAVDGPAIFEALVTLGAGASIAASELINKVPRPKSRCGHEGNSDVTAEVDRIVGLLGLVQEEELAALRKRVVELEELLKPTPTKSPAAKKPAKKSSTTKSTPKK